jgi:glycosyltransferase involved in cell wall biosynthesis
MVSKNPAFSVVLPCYNEEKNLPLILERYRQAAPKGLAWELLLVQNGSTDGSARALPRLLKAPKHRFARMVTVPVNQGYGYGLVQGLRAARGAFVAFSHADMQCDAADAFRAYDALRAAEYPQRTLVKGRRRGRAFGPSVVTTVMGVLASGVLWRPLWDINAQPKAFPRALVGAMADPPTGFEFDLYVLMRAFDQGFTVLSIPVVFGARAHGQSKWAATLASRWRTILRVMLYIFRLKARRS